MTTRKYYFNNKHPEVFLVIYFTIFKRHICGVIFALLFMKVEENCWMENHI